MNKTIALLILGVILLAMALIMVNQYMTQPDGTAMTPGGNVPMTVAPATPQMSSPDAVLSQLEQRGAISEAAPRESGLPISPPMPQSLPQGEPQNTPQAKQPAPQTMPAWASNGGSGVPSGENSGTALTPPGASTRSAEALSQGSTSVPPASPSLATAQPKPEQAKPAPTRAEQGKSEPSKPKIETPKVETPKAAKPKGPKTIKKIVVFRMDNEVAVRVEGSEALTYKTMHLKSPDRLVVDLDGEWAIKAPGVPDNTLVSNVRIGKQNDKTRIVIDLKQNPQAVRYVKRGAEGFDIRIK